MQNYIPVKNEVLLQNNGIHLKTTTLYRWRHFGKNPQLFLKIGNQVMIDLEEWGKFIDEAKKERNLRIKQKEKCSSIFNH